MEVVGGRRFLSSSRMEAGTVGKTLVEAEGMRVCIFGFVVGVPGASKETTFGWGRRAVFVFSGIYFGQKSFIVSEEVLSSFPRKHAKISFRPVRFSFRPVRF